MRALIVPAAAALALAACAKTGPSPQTVSDAAMEAVTPEMPLAELPVQQLSPGQCGLVLWQRADPPRRIFLALNQPAEARIVVDGKVVRLGRTDMSGGMMFGHAPRQRFDGRDRSVEIDITIEQRKGLVGGAVVTGGTLAYGKPGGSEIVLPVFGMIGCQPA